MEDFGGVIGGVIGGDMFVECLHGHIAGNVTRGVAAHAVGDNDKGTGVTVFVGKMGDQEGIFLIVPGSVDLRAR